jgi:protoheme IX farnesyltransferase
MIPLGERIGSFTAWQTLVSAVALLPLSLAPTILGHAGSTYLVGASVLSSIFLYFGARLVLGKSNVTARWLLFASILYLPLVFVLLVLDKAELSTRVSARKGQCWEGQGEIMR